MRDVSDDSLAAIVEIASPGNKDSKSRFEARVATAWRFLDERVHLLTIDPCPAGAREPNGLQVASNAHCSQGFTRPGDKLLTCYLTRPN